MKSEIATLVAGLACLAAFLVIRRVLRDQLDLGHPTLLAAVIVALGFLGLTSGGRGTIAFILLPYAALVLAAALLFLLLPLIGIGKGTSGRSRHGQDGSGRPPGDSANAQVNRTGENAVAHDGQGGFEPPPRRRGSSRGFRRVSGPDQPDRQSSPSSHGPQ